MDKQTTDLLQQLATKMGTTAEFLWSILVRQAYVQVVTDIVSYILVGAFIYATYKYVPKIWKKGDEVKAASKDSFEDPEIKYYLTSIALVAASCIFGIVMICSIPYTVATLLNPEYWALKQVLEVLK